MPIKRSSDNYRRMVWKRMSDLDADAPGDTTFDQYRRESLLDLQTALTTLFDNPVLALRDFGGLQDIGVFRFSKGGARNFHYKNLSGGEKAAFDLLLDIFVKRSEYQDAVYCVDEPEAHVNTSLHGKLLTAMLDLLPTDSQLWIATHSIGFVRRAYQIMRQTEDVIFLDFSGYDFDHPVTMTPRMPDRKFWRVAYEVALDDLADLVAPEVIVICEGKPSSGEQGFDAQCYNGIFAQDHPETLFVSLGSSKQVEATENLISILRAAVHGVGVRRLIDRDDMADHARSEKIEEGISVLNRREIENYLYDTEVLTTLYSSYGMAISLMTSLPRGRDSSRHQHRIAMI